MKPAYFCRLHHACEDGAKWAARYKTMHEVWEHCPRADLMLWILEKIDKPLDDKTERLFECWCVRHTPLFDGRTVWDLLTDQRSRTAVEVSERYAAGQATFSELDAASDAAWAASDAAWAVARAAWAVARAASDAAGAAWAASDAAWAASDAARAAMTAQADQLRKMVGNPFGKGSDMIDDTYHHLLDVAEAAKEAERWMGTTGAACGDAHRSYARLSKALAALEGKVPALLDRLDALEKVAQAARDYCGKKGAMDDVGYHNGGKILMEAFKQLEAK